MDEIYLLNGKLYTDKPKYTEIVSTELKNGILFHTVKKFTYLPHIILLILICIVAGILFSIPSLNHVINYNTTFHCYDDTLELNMFNSDVNSCVVNVCIYNEDGPIIDIVEIKPGCDVGSVKLLRDLEKASNMYMLDYTINAGWRSVTKTFDVLVIRDSK